MRLASPYPHPYPHPDARTRWRRYTYEGQSRAHTWAGLSHVAARCYAHTHAQSNRCTLGQGVRTPRQRLAGVVGVRRYTPEETGTHHLGLGTLTGPNWRSQTHTATWYTRRRVSKRPHARVSSLTHCRRFHTKDKEASPSTPNLRGSHIQQVRRGRVSRNTGALWEAETEDHTQTLCK